MMLLGFALSGCSYGYDLIAVVRAGRLVFIVDPASSQQPSCVRRVEVAEETSQRDALWLASVGYDEDCANKFPLPYGVTLNGHQQQDSKQIIAKPLRHGVIYYVSTTTDATGYGGGRFVIHSHGHVENLREPVDASRSGNAASKP